MWREPHGFHGQYPPSGLLQSISWNSHHHVSNKYRMVNRHRSVPNWHNKSDKIDFLEWCDCLRNVNCMTLTNVAVLLSWARKWSSRTVNSPTNKLFGITDSRFTTFSLWNWTFWPETATSAHTNTKNAIIFTTGLSKFSYSGFVKIIF